MLSGNTDIGILIGHLFMGLGFLIPSMYFKRNPPSYINGWYGYRTSVSMKNEDTWKEANAYSSKVIVIAAWMNLVSGIGLYVAVGGLKSIQIAGVLLTVLSIVVIVLTEMHLKQLFDASGNRKVRV